MKPDRCAVCGATVPLHSVHVIPRSKGGKTGPENLIYLCPNCHEQMDRGVLREFEFVSVLADLMRRSGAYSEVLLEPDVSALGAGERLRPDILAKTTEGTKRVLIECKSAPTVAGARLVEAIAQLNRYQETIRADETVLALPARLTQQQKASAEAAGAQVSCRDEIATRFSAHLNNVTHPILRPLLLGAAALKQPTAVPSFEAELLEELRKLPPGPTGWIAYQKLIARIFERLFCPPLSAPITELSDEAGANRRDIVLPNYADRGFWAFVRGRYCADFIVVDAKNHSSAVGKTEALQVLNYLKRHGAGLLGIIVSRLGPDASCLHTMREQWSTDGKLVIVLGDDHVERMLRTKEAGGPPEDVLRQWIEDFRLAL
jgi:HNH endonuclease